MASYDILAQGMIDKTLTGNPKLTHWRYAHRTCTRFAIESLAQPFNTTTAFGQESQILLNRVGDMVYFMYLHVTLPGIVACDGSTDPSCAGLAPGGAFPVYEPSRVNDADQVALMDYLSPEFNSMTPEEQEADTARAKNVWRREKYGARNELGCCTEGDSDCPTNTCPELEGVWAHYCNDVGHFMIEKAKLLIGGQQVDQLMGVFLFCWEELTGKSGRRLTELTGRRYTRAQLVCDSGEERELFVPLPSGSPSPPAPPCPSPPSPTTASSSTSTSPTSRSSSSSPRRTSPCATPAPTSASPPTTSRPTWRSPTSTSTSPSARSSSPPTSSSSSSRPSTTSRPTTSRPAASRLVSTTPHWN